jgi:hypothetical protein
MSPAFSKSAQRPYPTSTNGAVIPFGPVPAPLYACLDGAMVFVYGLTTVADEPRSSQPSIGKSSM